MGLGLGLGLGLACHAPLLSPASAAAAPEGGAPPSSSAAYLVSEMKRSLFTSHRTAPAPRIFRAPLAKACGPTQVASSARAAKLSRGFRGAAAERSQPSKVQPLPEPLQLHVYL